MAKTLIPIIKGARPMDRIVRIILSLLLLLPFMVRTTIAADDSHEGAILSATFSAAPIVGKSPDGERWILFADLQSGELKGLTVRLASAGWPEQNPISLGDLPQGKRRVRLDMPALAEHHSLKASFAWANGAKTFESITLVPPKKWTVYLAQHTHTDIGYTRPQTEILPEHLRYIDYALDYCDLTDAYPDDAKFRWTCETSWAVREYLDRRPAEQIERLKKRIQQGRIEITGMMLNMSEIATESSMAASLQPIHTLKNAFGVPVRMAMQNDVNGIAWCLVDYFSHTGVKYLTMGINKDRSLLPFDKPTSFWWESPSGKRLLAYRADHYHTGNFWKIHQGDIGPFKPGLTDYLRSLEDRHYPFDRVGVQFSGYRTDNSPPATVECDLVRKWNETYAWPRLRIATACEFLEYVEKEHSQELPVHRQAWPDWWTDGFGSAARETAASRQTHSELQASENLLAMAAVLGARMPRGVLRRIAAIQDDLLFYDEHTYGAAESISDPLAENTQVQWAEKSAYVWTAVKNSNLLREEALGLLQDCVPRAQVPTIAIFNTLNWERSGQVQIFIDHEILPADKEFRIVDDPTSQVVPAQSVSSRAEGTYWALWVKDVPPLGYKVLRIEVGKNPRAAQREAETAKNTLENAFYSLALDPDKGAIKSWLDKETGQELADPDCAWGLGQCIHETLPANRALVRSATKRTSLRNVNLQKGSEGAIWKSLKLSADLDGCAGNQGVKLEIRLFEPEKRIEFHFALRKAPLTSPEAVYVSFPFRCPGGKLIYEAQGGLVTPGADQIPGSASDWQTLQSFISIRNPDGQIVYGSDQAPLVQLGDFNLGKWQPVTQVEKPHVYSWVLNNYWFTNFRASQEGDLKWSYYLTSTRDPGNQFATRFGWGSRIPLVCRVLPPGQARTPNPPVALSALNLKVPQVLVVSARPALAGDGLIFHLREVEGKPATIRREDLTTWTPILQADEVNVLEEVLSAGIKSLSFQPFEVKFVKITL